MAGAATYAGLYYSGQQGIIANDKAIREKKQLKDDYKYLTSLYSPIRSQLIKSYMPGGEFSNRLAGLNREQANAMRYGGEESARTNAYRTGGIRSGAVDRGRRGSWLNLMSQGQTSADMEALSRLSAQNLTSKGAEIRGYQYPGFGSRLAGLPQGLIYFDKEFEKNKQPANSQPVR